MPGGRSGQPGSRCARGTNTLRAAGLAAGALRGRSTTLRAARLADGRGLSSTFSLWTLGLADGRGLSPLLWTSGLADGVGLLDLSEEVGDFWPSSEVEGSELAPPSSWASELAPPFSSVGESLMSTLASFRGCVFGGGGISVRAFVLGMSSTRLAGTWLAGFDLAGGGATFELATRQGPLRRGPSAAAVAACLAPTALAPHAFGTNTPVPRLRRLWPRLRPCCASSASESSVSEGASEGAGGSACGSQEPPNFGNPGALAEAATAASADGVGFDIEPPLPLDPRGGRATACLSRARGGRRGRHEGQMARGQEGKGTPTIAMTV